MPPGGRTASQSTTSALLLEQQQLPSPVRSRKDSGSTVATAATAGNKGGGFIPAGQNLIEEERAEEGGVKWVVYGYYARCIGIAMGVTALVFYLGYQVW